MGDVVDEERVLPRLGDVDDAERAVRVLLDAALALDAEADPLAVLEVDPVPLLLAHDVERAVVVDVAVLEDLDECRPAVPRRRAEDVREALLVGVDRARDERRLCADRHRERVEGMVERAERSRLRDLPELGRRRVLPLREPVDAVVEEEDLQVHVAAQRVDEVVPADRERVAVAGDDPHGEVGPRHGEAGRDRGRATVDRVHPVRLHVVREPGGAADAGDEDDPLALEPELGHEALHDVEDRVVAAAGAPAHFLVGLEVLRGQLHEAVPVAITNPPAP